MRDNIAAGPKYSGAVRSGAARSGAASRRFSRSRSLFADTFTKGAGRSPRASPRDYANESTQRGSTDGQSAALLPSGNHKPAAFSSSTKTRTDNAFRSPTVLPRTRRRRSPPRGGRGGTGVSQGSKYNRPEDMKNETEDRRRAIRQLRGAASQTRK